MPFQFIIICKILDIGNHNENPKKIFKKKVFRMSRFVQKLNKKKVFRKSRFVQKLNKKNFFGPHFH